MKIETRGRSLQQNATLGAPIEISRIHLDSTDEIGSYSMRYAHYLGNSSLLRATELTENITRPSVAMVRRGHKVARALIRSGSAINVYVEPRVHGQCLRVAIVSRGGSLRCGLSRS